MQKKTSRPFLRIMVVCLVACAARISFASTINPGDLIVADSDSPDLPNGAKIIDINPKTGAQTLIASGGSLEQPTALCFDAAGNIIVADYGFAFPQAGSIIRINPNTGQQTVVSTGGSLAFPTGIAVDSQGDYIVSQQGVDQSTGAVLEINPQTGAQTVIASGAPLGTTEKLSIDAAGNYFVTDFQARGGSNVVEINPTSGVESVVSSGGYLSDGPHGVWVNNSQPDSLLVTEGTFGNPSLASLLEINPLTGSQTVLSSGGSLGNPTDVTQNSLGRIFVTDEGSSGTSGKVLSIDPTTGAQTVIASGGYLLSPLAIAVVTPEPTTEALAAAGLMALAICSRLKRRGLVKAVWALDASGTASREPRR